MTPSKHHSLGEEEAAAVCTRWYEAFLSFFVEVDDASVASDQMDDLLFFVKEERDNILANTNDKQEERILVRRRSSNDLRLPILGQPIDWMHSFLLNLILHSTFFLRVSVCDRRTECTNNSLTTNLVVRHQVGQMVFASHHEIHISERHNQLNTHPPCSYPIIYFGMDNLEDVFDGFMVEPNQVMCVELLLLKEGMTMSRLNQVTI